MCCRMIYIRKNRDGNWRSMDRILGMMVERAVYDMQSENVSEEEIEAVLTEINRRLAEDDGSARQNEKEIILEKEAMLRKRMQMAAEVRQ